MRSLSNFGSKIIFMCSVDFWHHQDSNKSFKGSISHVTSKCNWPISMVLAFSYGQAKMSGIQYVNLVPRALFPGSKARGKSPGDEVDRE